MVSAPEDGGYKGEKQAVTMKSKRVMWDTMAKVQAPATEVQELLDPALLLPRPGYLLFLVSLIHYTILTFSR